jgi:hypothetical protein
MKTKQKTFKRVWEQAGSQWGTYAEVLKILLTVSQNFGVALTQVGGLVSKNSSENDRQKPKITRPPGRVFSCRVL